MADITQKLRDRILSIFGDREDAREMIELLTNYSAGPIPPFSLMFNAATDWTDDGNGNYFITILASEHNNGTIPTVTIYGTDGINYNEVTVDQLLIDDNGDVTFTIPSSPDSRFSGKVIIS